MAVYGLCSASSCVTVAVSMALLSADRFARLSHASQCPLQVDLARQLLRNKQPFVAAVRDGVLYGRLCTSSGQHLHSDNTSCQTLRRVLMVLRSVHTLSQEEQRG
jgi:hypothetical protein